MSSNDSLTDTVELVQFRQRWKAEVQQRQIASHSVSGQPALVPPPRPLEDRDTGQIISEEPSRLQQAFTSLKGSASNVPGAEVRNLHDFQFTNVSVSLSKRKDKALVAYRAACQAEQRGALDDALLYYRQAFRLDSFVDKAHFREEQRLAQQIAAIIGKDRGTTLRQLNIPDDGSGASESSVSLLERGIQTLSLHTSNTTVTATGTLASVISAFPEHLSFDPEDETRNCFVSLLSDELVILILRYLDTTSIECFALVDRKARVFTLDREIWRSFVRSIYFYPQVPADYLPEHAVQKYHNDYRRLYVEQPRIRLDGVYIAVCHYVRQGYSDNLWVQTSYLITYHRYLRFFPDGRVICLRANEDQPPQTIIPQLGSTPTMDLKDMSIGRWHLDGTAVLVTDIKYIHDGNPRHAFQMCLGLRSKPVGRWNKLDFMSFDSVNLETGETEPLPLKNERAFWFSKVRSYS